MYPESKIFGLTTGLAVMKINSELGYEPVTYSELTQDDAFWAGCKSCVNYEILMSKERKNCMCTAMLYDPKDHYEPEETKQFFEEKKGILERLLRIKQWKFLQPFLKKIKMTTVPKWCRPPGSDPCCSTSLACNRELPFNNIRYYNQHTSAMKK
ncbi:hypothetical protein [Paraflavitalea speifideaquila]|uniref:hypothetical protein n=1 Tax=Paraflavitalea speifideaquila TaxID=3076558 RepID=UPI0028E4AF43|nr:hypothetical protein [Paraflavitalea speifideiaquila]